MTLSLFSCSKKKGENSDDSSQSQMFPNDKMSHSIMDDGDFYLKVKTVNGDEEYIREYAAKGDNIYANVKNGWTL